MKRMWSGRPCLMTNSMWTSKVSGDAGIWTRGLLHAKQALYRWATSPAVKTLELKVHMVFECKNDHMTKSRFVWQRIRIVYYLGLHLYCIKFLRNILGKLTWKCTTFKPQNRYTAPWLSWLKRLSSKQEIPSSNLGGASLFFPSFPIAPHWHHLDI